MKQLSIIVLLSIMGVTAGYVYKFFHTETRPVAARRIIAEETDWADYCWPTNASTVRTSCFAEFRANHFHAGIDISTNMHTGYDVYASREGSLHSITFEPGGYGWYLVLRHKDGYFTCYAHLSGFPAKIREAYYAKLAAGGHSYGYVEWRDGEVPVKKREVVAYSGNSGIGPPHLHFEVRDKGFNPVNPGLSKNLRPLDSIPPELLEVCLTPLDQTSTINGKFDQVIMHVTKKAAGKYVLAGKPVLCGRIGVMLKAVDHAQGAQDSPTPYSIALLVDGKEYFRSQFDRIQNELGWHIRIDRDHWLMQKMKGEFRKLFREDGNVLSVYTPMSENGGVLAAEQIGAGERQLSIIARDLSGNTSSVAFPVTIMRLLTPVTVLRNDTLTVFLTELKNISALRIYGASGSSWQLRKEWKNSALSQRLVYPISDNREIMKVVASDEAGNASMPVYAGSASSQKHPASGFSVARSQIHDEYIFHVSAKTPFEKMPEIRFPNGGGKLKATVLWESPQLCRIVVKAMEGFAGPEPLIINAVVGGETRTWSGELAGALVSASKGGSIKSEDGRMEARFDLNTVYHNELCWVQQRGEGATAAYQLMPDNVPLAGPVTVSVKASVPTKDLFIRATHPGVFYRFSKDVHGGENGVVSGSFPRMPALYSLASDSEGPAINISASSTAVKIRISDNAVGIKPESISVQADGSILPVEYSEVQRLYVIPREYMKSLHGKTVKVSAADMLGNVSTAQAVVR